MQIKLSFYQEFNLFFYNYNLKVNNFLKIKKVIKLKGLNIH